MRYRSRGFYACRSRDGRNGLFSGRRRRWNNRGRGPSGLLYRLRNRLIPGGKLFALAGAFRFDFLKVVERRTGILHLFHFWLAYRRFNRRLLGLRLHRHRLMLVVRLRGRLFPRLIRLWLLRDGRLPLLLL